MEVRGQPRLSYTFDGILRIIFSGAVLCLLSLAWGTGHVPVVHASGVPYCGKLADERASTSRAIHLNRAEGPAGTDLAVTASGWHPGARVALHFDARNPKTGEMYILLAQFAQATAGKDGTVNLSSLEAPSFYCVDLYSTDQTTYHFDQAGGTVGYFVLVADDGEVSAPVAFKYLPAPAISANGVDPAFHDTKVGSTVIVTGSNWEAHEPLTLTLQDPVNASASVPYAAQTHALTDAQGTFTATYPLDARLHWGSDVMLTVEGSGPRFGSLVAQTNVTLLPAVKPTFQLDRTLVTPGMTITVSGEHWYPGDSIPLKLCNAQMLDGSWSFDGNCGKAVWPILAKIPIDASGQMLQRVTIPSDTSPGESIFVIEVDSRIGVQPIPVQVVDHLPTWDDIHPRVAALRNKMVSSLPFTIPATLALLSLIVFALRRWRGRRVTG